MKFRVIKDTFLERIHFFSVDTKIIPLFTEKRVIDPRTRIRTKQRQGVTYIQNDGDALHTFQTDKVFELFPSLRIEKGKAKIIEVIKIENGYVIREIPCAE